MRKLVVAAYVSLDGVMQAPGAPEEDPTGGFAHGGWTFHYWDRAMHAEMGELLASPFSLLLGRRTYEMFAAHWPDQGDEDPIARAFNRAAKYVATSSSEPLAWPGSIALRGDIPAKIARLKQEDGPTLLTQGSGVLVQALLGAGLIDEFRLLVFPLLLGRGKRLFVEGIRPSGLKLIESRTSSTGVILSTYVPAGAIRTGSFVPDPPGAAEAKRRERLRQESGIG